MLDRFSAAHLHPRRCPRCRGRARRYSGRSPATTSGGSIAWPNSGPICSRNKSRPRSLPRGKQNSPVGKRWRRVGHSTGRHPRISSDAAHFSLEHFGFRSDLEDPFEVDAPLLHRIGGGVEALAFADDEGSVYKFFLFREDGATGATFSFQPGSDCLLEAQCCLGTYRNLLEKLAVINAIGGMPTEITGVTPEGILVAKQTFGRRIPEGTDTSKLLPARLFPFPQNSCVAIAIIRSLRSWMTRPGSWPIFTTAIWFMISSQTAHH